MSMVNQIKKLPIFFMSLYETSTFKIRFDMGFQKMIGFY